MTGRLVDVVLAQIEDLTRDAGYLLRRLDPDSSASFLAERIGDGLMSLDASVFPSAAELRGDFFAICGDHDLAVEEALRVADARARLLRELLRPKARR